MLEALAQKIREGRHGGEAARLLTKNTDREKSKEREQNNIGIMSELFKLKSEQCPEFTQAIMEDYRILAAAIRDPFWGTCLSVKDTMNAKPDIWPGKNMMEALRMELCKILKGDETNEPGARISHNTDIAIDTPQHCDNDKDDATVQTEIQ